MVMYDEAEYIFREFEKHFSGKKEEPLVLYGTGNRTGELLERLRGYHIAGLMDGKKKEGTVFGKQVLDYREVLELQVKTIIVIARPAVMGVIYHRIEGFCKENGITVYDVKGNDLSEVYADQENDIPYFRQGREDLERELERHEVVSFDVFDTLVMRKVLYPTDIFTIVERKKPYPGFAGLRTEAERQLCGKGRNPTHQEIYRRFQEMSGVSDREREELRELETATELEYLVPREKMRDIFRSIKGKKKIYLISELDLPRETMGKLLGKCGYGGYQELYVSCEKGTAKNGELFRLFLEDRKKEGYAPRDCLHVGDNEVADIACAKEAGMDAFQVMGAGEMLGSSSYRGLLSGDLDFTDRLAAGLLAEKAFGNPFALYGTKGRPEITDVRKFSYMLVAPMIFSFTVWLMQEVRKSGCGYVLYPSRDAYLIEKLCGMICQGQQAGDFPPGEYFYTSRRAVLAATLWNERDIARTAKDFRGNIRELFRKRFGIAIEARAEEIPARDEKELEGYLDRYREEILEQSRRERENYTRYMAETGIRDHQRIAVIDFVAAGKIQNGLEKLMPEKEFRGFYFLRRNPDKNELDRDIRVESFFPSRGAFEINYNVYKFYLFMEMVLTSREPTFHSVSDRGEKVFMEETRSREHRKTVEEMQEGVLEYAREFSALCPDLLEMQVNRQTPDIILGFLGKEYTALEMQEVTSLELTDEFLGQTFNIFQG